MDLASYLAVVTIYVARITAAVAFFLAFSPVWRALRICWANRELPLSSIVPLLRPFDLRLLLLGVIFAAAGSIYGAMAFIALDVRFVTRFSQLPADLSVATTWSLWAMSGVAIAAAFAANPRAIYRAVSVFVIGGVLLAGLSGRFG